ncbi:MAG: 4-hydroxy-3-methylbut-2-enyl diphosphate reductase [Candidatus Omnitrophica bacterium]|nr:4-hydroxy-3-methylbut-2-enyl diphosphate reductase [Candidatus Omnitrophota bacterium]
MKINLAKSAGFCFGVKRAIKIALEISAAGKKAYMLGDIVHNEEVAKQIEKSGLKKIKQLKAGKGKILLIRAHGAPKKIYQTAAKLGYQIIDATCPKVHQIHKIARQDEALGYTIIIIGDQRHDEVNGIIGQLKTKALIISSYKNIPYKKLLVVKKASVVVQSTQNLENVLKIIAVLKQQIKDLKFHNTICQPTTLKQQELRILPRKNDLMLVIGSKTSANTKRLYQIAKALNQKTYWVKSAKDLKKIWFKGISSVGVTAGASTPDYVTKAVIDQIKRLSTAGSL